MNILFIDTVHPSLQRLLQAAGHTCRDGSKLSQADVFQCIGDFQGVVIRSRFRLDRSFLDRAVGLKFIARAGAGMENIDVPYAESKGIHCLHAPEGNRDAVGEHALGMLLSLYTNLNKADREVRNGEWKRERNRGNEVMGKTVGIVGFGNTGSALAKKLAGFECRILAYDKYKKGFGDTGIEEVSMEELYNEADIVSLHVPLTDETRYLADDAFFGRFRKSITIINTSRGPCLNTTDLIKHMQSGKVSGACLDVVEYEDTAFENNFSSAGETWQYLVQSDRVVLSPHIAGWTHESNEKMAKILFNKISALNL